MSVDTTNTLKFFHADRQGSVIAIADASGTLTEGPYTYDPYGQSASSTAGVPFRYTGRRLDADTGLYYYRARYYAPALGRFLQTDPVGYADQMNMYAYVSNDPFNLIDPTGNAGCADAPGQGLGGNCIDASNYDAKTDGTATTVSKPDVDKKALEVAPSLNDKNVEKATTIDRNDNGTLSRGDESTGKEKIKGQETEIAPSSRTEAVIHSHPGNDDYSVAPGYHDKTAGDHTPVEAGLPNYITRDGKTIVVEKSGGQYRVRVIGGTLTAQERRDISRALRQFQVAGRADP